MNPQGYSSDVKQADAVPVVVGTAWACSVVSCGRMTPWEKGRYVPPGGASQG